MKTIGIIAEFNPFHNGHHYLISEAKRLTGASRVVVVMSGNYVERGGPAFIDKFSRTSMALECGADVVIELPSCYAMSGASYFARGAVSLLHSLNMIDYLCFGSEYTDLDILNSIADILTNEPIEFKKSLKSNLSSGISFSESRVLALKEYLSIQNHNLSKSDKPDTITEEISDMLSSPNSILAIEYLISLKKLQSNIKPFIIKRTDKGYHSNEVIYDKINKTNFISASGIRQTLTSSFISEALPDRSHMIYELNNTNISKSVPKKCYEIMHSCINKSFPILEDDFSYIIGYSLVSFFKINQLTDRCVKETFNHSFFDVSYDMTMRIANLSDSFISVSDFINKCNSKIFTSAYCRRAVFNILFDYTREDYEYFNDNGLIFYYRILGFNKNHMDLLKKIKNNAQHPMITKLSSLPANLSEAGKNQLSLNMKADSVYRNIANIKFKNNGKNEHQTGMIIISK